MSLVIWYRSVLLLALRSLPAQPTCRPLHILHLKRTLALLSLHVNALPQFNYGFDNQVRMTQPIFTLQPAACPLTDSIHTDHAQAFAQSQAMDALGHNLGEYNPTTDVYAIPTV